MFDFTYPQALLLAIPVAAVLYKLRPQRKLLLIIQIAIAALLLVVLAHPKLRMREKGTDLIMVLDRSSSMPAEAPARMEELISLVAKARGPGDRLGVVTFGDGVQVQMLPDATAIYGADPKPTLPYSSDLNTALETAMAIVPADRPGRILLLSDGEYTGSSPISAARQGAARGLPIDHRVFSRPEQGDIAVERIVLPHKVNSGEPFQFSAVVQADIPISAEYLLLRGDKVLAKGRAQFQPGPNRLVFRDILIGRGVCQYRLKLLTEKDPRPENNLGYGVVEVVNAPAVMVVNSSGQDDNLTRALRKAGIPVKLFSEDTASFSMDLLQGFRGVILENIPASKIGRAGMIRLANFVESLGGGLLITGGQRSFANGGYFKSPLDQVLPVSMEIRQEQRKVGIALAIALDRSGSMMAPVGGGLRKMDLANLGTVASLELLGPSDSVAVIAVDSSAHIIQPLTPCDEPERIASRVRKIESMGGGIFVYTALLAAGKEIERAPQLTKHIILFSDAADSEEPGKYKELLAAFEKMNITVSVIGLGTPTDSDADFLRDVARRGQGQISFTNDPHDLPRLFAQDTIAVTRSSFVEEPTPIKPLAGLVMLTSNAYKDIPSPGGYNLTYLRPRATKGITTLDEYDAPALAFWRYGLGRAAAFTPELDGKFTGALSSWPKYGDFLVTLGRYVLGEAEPKSVQAKMTLTAGQAKIIVEIDPDKPLPNISKPTVVVLPPQSQGQPSEPKTLPLEWVGPTRLQASFPVKQTGTYRAVVQLGQSRLLRTNPITLPYSPEFAPRGSRISGKETLRELAKITGGKERLSMENIFARPAISSHERLQDITLPLLLALLVLIVLEIAERRLSLITSATRLATRGLSTATLSAKRAISTVRVPRPRKIKTPDPKHIQADTAQPDQVTQDEPSPPKAQARPKEDTVDKVLDRMKRRRRSGK